MLKLAKLFYYYFKTRKFYGWKFDQSLVGGEKNFLFICLSAEKSLLYSATQMVCEIRCAILLLLLLLPLLVLLLVLLLLLFHLRGSITFGNCANLLECNVKAVVAFVEPFRFKVKQENEIFFVSEFRSSIGNSQFNPQCCFDQKRHYDMSTIDELKI